MGKVQRSLKIVDCVTTEVLSIAIFYFKISEFFTQIRDFGGFMTVHGDALFQMTSTLDKIFSDVDRNMAANCFKRWLYGKKNFDHYSFAVPQGSVSGQYIMQRSAVYKRNGLIPLISARATRARRA